ncbi:MAG: alpha/beta hydrolase [Chloroflexota bacterium]
MPKARVNGVELFYEVSGSGQPVLFIHGGYGGAETTVVTKLAPEITGILPQDRFQVVTYDRRNAGQSEYTDAHYTIDDLAEDARALLDHLGIDRAIVVGSSAGGPIALQFALTYPQRTFALCLPNTGVWLMNPARPRSKAFAEMVARSRSEGDRAVFESRKAALRQAAPLGGLRASDPAAIQRHAAVQQALATISDDELLRLSTGEVRNAEAFQGYDFSARLTELQMPVCVIHGTADATVPFAWGEALAQGIPGAEFHPIEGADHGVLAYPGAQEALRAWTDRVTSTVPA